MHFRFCRIWIGDFEDKVLLAVLLDDASCTRQPTESRTVIQTLSRKNIPSIALSHRLLERFIIAYLCRVQSFVVRQNYWLHMAPILMQRPDLMPMDLADRRPVFHTVNQHANKSVDVLKVSCFIGSRRLDLNLTVKGLIWGKGYEWETFVPAVNPISYAMMGLLRQFQRTESGYL